jgi:hypothetical protein
MPPRQGFDYNSVTHCLVVAEGRVPNCDAQLSARFEHADSRHELVQILSAREIDEFSQCRIIKESPPLTIVLTARIDQRIIYFEPLRRDCGRRSLKVRANHAGAEKGGGAEQN